MKGDWTLHGELKIQTAARKGGRVQVQAHDVKIEGFENYEFFLYQHDGIYYVCECQTGLSVAAGEFDAIEALENVSAKLAGLSKAEFRRVFNRGKKMVRDETAKEAKNHG